MSSHVADHFTDPEAACGIVIESDRLLDHRLGGEGFDIETGSDLEGFHGIRRGEDGCWRDELRGDDGLHIVVTLAVALLGEERGGEKNK